MQIIEITKDNLKKSFKGKTFEVMSNVIQNDTEEVVKDEALIEILYNTIRFELS